MLPEVEFVLMENCFHCPNIIGSSGKNCELPDERPTSAESKRDIAEKKMQRQKFDEQFSVLNFTLCRLASISVVGVWGLCAEFHHAVVDNAFLDEHCFLGGSMPPLRSNHHPAHTFRKMSGAIELISRNQPFGKTRPKRTNEFEFKKNSFISANDEKHLIYRVFEEYFESLLSLNGGIINIRDLFSTLEKSSLHQAVFSENYETMMSSPGYLSMTPKIVSLIKHDSRVKSAKYKVSYSFCLSSY
jgi:hypothetical protein